MTEIESSSEHGRRFVSHAEISGFLWSIADLLRGDYKRHDYGKVILPLTVVRRLDCVIGPDVNLLGLILKSATGDESWVGVLDRTLQRVELREISGRLDAHQVFVDCFKISEQIDRLRQADLLRLVIARFAEVDLSPEAVSNQEMGLIFEDLIRRFAEQSNETAGEHFTPREVIRLMADLLFSEDAAMLNRGVEMSLYDPACGTGGMLSMAEDYLREHYSEARLEVFGQELNAESYAICRADMLLKGQEPGNIALGNSFSEDGHAGRRFDYMLSNPPFGLEWKKVEAIVRREHEEKGYKGRFGAGLPRINDGSFLFLQHMLAKRKDPERGGSRLAIVFNGSPLFTGDAGSGESEIRRWILENDWLETVVALPDQLFFGTGIHTYLWVLTNRKSSHREGKVQLIHAVNLSSRMEKSLGDKRNELSPEQIDEIARVHHAFEEKEWSRIVDTHELGYHRIVVERPLRLSYAVTAERIARLEDSSVFRRLGRPRGKGQTKEALREKGRATQKALLAVLEERISEESWLDTRLFLEDFERWLDEAGIELAPKVRENLALALGERDRRAAIVRETIREAIPGEDSEEAVESAVENNAPRPDPELRDTEQVPIGGPIRNGEGENERARAEIQKYFEAEVKVHVPDAWVDHERTRVGYEIPMNRYFYRYEPPGNVVEVEKQIRKLERDMRGLLGEILA